MQNDYAYWRDALTGKFGPIHDGDPQPGFYRLRRRQTLRDVRKQRPLHILLLRRHPRPTGNLPNN